MRKISLLSLLCILCSCANYATPSFQTECGSFWPPGNIHACKCLETDEAKKKLGDEWEPRLKACQETALITTDEEIAAMDEKQACFERYDPRVNKHIEKNGFLCSANERLCRDKGYQVNSAKYSNCLTLENRKDSDPAFAYCLDRGFKIDTEKMSMCMVEKDNKIAQELQVQQMIRAAEAQRRQQQDLAEKQQRANAWQNFTRQLQALDQQQQLQAQQCGSLSLAPIASVGCKNVCINGRWAEVCG